jgi:hypothetical protein
MISYSQIIYINAIALRPTVKKIEIGVHNLMVMALLRKKY